MHIQTNLCLYILRDVNAYLYLDINISSQKLVSCMDQLMIYSYKKSLISLIIYNSSLSQQKFLPKF